MVVPKIIVRWLICCGIIVFFAVVGFTEDLRPWNDPSCDFRKENQKFNPKDLVREYLIRDGRGDFLKSDSWLDSVTICPGHLPGTDVFSVIAEYKIEKSEESKSSTIIQVKYKILGTFASGGDRGELNAFTAKRESKTESFEVEHTPYGWRLKEFPSGMVLAKSAAVIAAKRKWVPGDAEEFQEATGTKLK